jgi:hypothetical protein
VNEVWASGQVRAAWTLTHLRSCYQVCVPADSIRRRSLQDARLSADFTHSLRVTGVMCADTMTCTSPLLCLLAEVQGITLLTLRSSEHNFKVSKLLACHIHCWQKWVT